MTGMIHGALRAVTIPVLMSGTAAPVPVSGMELLTPHGASPKYLPVSIFFFDVSDDDAWEPLDVDQDDPNAYWNGGGFLRNAPVDAAATFEKAIRASTKVDPAFGWRGRQIRAGFTVPLRHQSQRALRIVVAGSLEVEYDPHGSHGTDAVTTETVGPAGFWTVEAGMPYRMTAGPQGVSYLECWDGHPSLVETHWHDDPSWVRPNSIRPNSIRC